MSEESSSSVGCGDWITSFIIGWLITANILASIMKIEVIDLPWWGHLVALLTGLPIYFLLVQLFGGALNALARLFRFFGSAMVGIVLLIFFIIWDLGWWTCLLGVVFLVVGFFCNRQAMKILARKVYNPFEEEGDSLIAHEEWRDTYKKKAQNAAAPWAANSLGAYVLGLAMIIAGIVMALS